MTLTFTFGPANDLEIRVADIKTQNKFLAHCTLLRKKHTSNAVHDTFHGRQHDLSHALYHTDIAPKSNQKECARSKPLLTCRIIICLYVLGRTHSYLMPSHSIAISSATSTPAHMTLPNPYIYRQILPDPS